MPGSSCPPRRPPPGFNSACTALSLSGRGRKGRWVLMGRHQISGDIISRRRGAARRDVALTLSWHCLCSDSSFTCGSNIIFAVWRNSNGNSSRFKGHYKHPRQVEHSGVKHISLHWSDSQTIIHGRFFVFALGGLTKTISAIKQRTPGSGIPSANRRSLVCSCPGSCRLQPAQSGEVPGRLK